MMTGDDDAGDEPGEHRDTAGTVRMVLVSRPRGERSSLPGRWSTYSPNRMLTCHAT